MRHAIAALSTRQPFTTHACLPTTNSYTPGSQDTLDDGMGADFDQARRSPGGVRAAGLALRQATKGGGVGWGIIDVLQGAIDGHQLQAKGEGPRSVIDLVL